MTLGDNPKIFFLQNCPKLLRIDIYGFFSTKDARWRSHIALDFVSVNDAGWGPQNIANVGEGKAPKKIEKNSLFFIFVDFYNEFNESTNKIFVDFRKFNESTKILKKS